MKVPLSQTDARKVYVECNSITVNENFPLLPKKKRKRLIAGYLNTLMALLSFFLTATAESAGAGKAPNSRRSDSVGRCKEKRAKEKEVLRAGREGEETLLSPFSFLPLFFLCSLCTTLHCLNTWNRLAPELTQPSTKNFFYSATQTEL